MGSLIDNKKDNFFQTKYMVSEFKVLIGGETIVLKDINIGTIRIENNYETDLFPLFKVQILITQPIYNKIIKAKNECKFKVRIQKYNMSIDGKKSMFSDFINDVFVIYHGEADTDNTKDITKERYKTSGDKESNAQVLNELNSVMELFLFKESYVNNLHKVVNMIVESSNVTQMTTYLLNMAGLSNVIMSPFQSGQVYNVMIFPPQDIIHQLFYLDRHYGYYIKGAMIFFGLENPYILNMLEAQPTAWKKGEWKTTTIIVLNKGSAYNNIPANFSRGSEKVHYINVNADYVNITNLSIADNVVSGVGGIVIDSKNDNTRKEETQAIVRGSTKNAQAIPNDTVNIFLSETYAAQKASESITIEVVCSDINVEALTPNKRINIVFEDSKINNEYKGTYYTAGTTFHFNKEGGEYRLVVDLKLKRCQLGVLYN